MKYNKIWFQNFQKAVDGCHTSHLDVSKRNSVIQSLNRVQLFATPRTVARQVSLFVTASQTLLKLISIELEKPSNHLVLCRPFLLLPSIFPSIRVFSSKLTLCQYWSFSVSLSSEYSQLISLRINWFDLLAGQGTLKSLLQHHSSKVSILQQSAFFYGPTLTSVHDNWKNHSLLTKWCLCFFFFGCLCFLTCC